MLSKSIEMLLSHTRLTTKTCCLRQITRCFILKGEIKDKIKYAYTSREIKFNINT